MKRPLCLASVVFLGICCFLAGGLQLSEDQKPSPLEQYTRDGDELILQGTVSKREERPEYQILSLTDVQIRHKEQFIEESKLHCLCRTNKQSNNRKRNRFRPCIGGKSDPGERRSAVF